MTENEKQKLRTRGIFVALETKDELIVEREGGDGFSRMTKDDAYDLIHEPPAWRLMIRGFVQWLKQGVA